MKPIRHIFATLSTIGALASVGACNVEDVGAPDTTEVGDEDPALDEMYTVTVVDLDRGGEVISQKWVSKREQIVQRERLAELEAQGLGQSQEAIAQDPDCIVGSPIGLPAFSAWDQTGYAGNRICFAGDGTADLRSYCLLRAFPSGTCIQWWGGRVESFKTGNADFSFQFTPGAPCTMNCNVHNQNEDVSSASTCEQGANFITIDAIYNPC
jgi:hypothetical protein